MKKTLSVFIPAYNEEKNIKSLLEQILAQTEENFILEKILVVSDASTDNTENEVRSLNNQKIELVINPERKGKWFGFTVAQEKLSSEIIVSLDSDIIILDHFFLKKITSSSDKSDIISVRQIPAPAHCIFEKMVSFWMTAAVEMYEKGRPETDAYLCNGRCIAMRKVFFNKVKWINIFGTDVFMYLESKQYGAVFDYLNNTEIIYKVPKNIHDYILQSTRARKVREVMKNKFDSRVIQEHFLPINLKIKILVAIKYLFKNFIFVLYYCGVRVFCYFKKEVKEVSALWPVSKTTK